MASARIGFPATDTPHAKLLDDHRFRALLPAEDWGRLPVAIWRRFSKRLVDGATVVYVGEVEEASFSRAGWWIAQAARLIGGPLPTSTVTGVPMIVTVTEDAASGGQVWTRICARHHGFPQVIHSAKRFAGPTVKCAIFRPGRPPNLRRPCPSKPVKAVSGWRPARSCLAAI